MDGFAAGGTARAAGWIIPDDAQGKREPTAKRRQIAMRFAVSWRVICRLLERDSRQMAESLAVSDLHGGGRPWRRQACTGWRDAP